MRIVGGKYRHRLIVFPDDMEHTRPTDLYAGSGAMGLEALSRGAKFCAFVDVSNLAIKVIKDNINNLKINETEYQLIKDKDVNALEQFKNKGQKFDLVFLDPPYEQGQYQQIVDLLISNNLLNEHAIIVIEANRDVNLENIDYNKKKEYHFDYNKKKEYHYGEIKVFIYWR